MKTQRLLVLLITVVAVAVFAIPTQSSAQLVLYDDFTLTTIDPEKWLAFQQSFGGRNTETLRKITAKKLNVLLTTFGGTSTDSGNATGRDDILFTHPGPITTIQAGVTIKLPLVEGCPANATTARTRALLLGFFFNDSTSPAPGDATGNVFALIEKLKDSTLGNVIRAGFGRCLSNDCAFAPFLDSHTFAASWVTGRADTLRLEWDQPNSQFVFTLNPGKPGEEIAPMPYALSDTTPLQRFDQKNLRVTNTVPNCTAARKKASMSGFFDNVMINP